MSCYVQFQPKIRTLIHQAEPLGSSPEDEDNDVKRKQSAEEVGCFVGFRGISDSHRMPQVDSDEVVSRGARVH